MCNKEIRQEIAKRRLKQYEVANALKLSEFTFSRKLRTEMPKEEKERILTVIENMQI